MVANQRKPLNTAYFWDLGANYYDRGARSNLWIAPRDSRTSSVSRERRTSKYERRA
jgi:hypothetical protein